VAARRNAPILFIESSAKTAANVSRIFETVAETFCLQRHQTAAAPPQALPEAAA